MPSDMQIALKWAQDAMKEYEDIHSQEAQGPHPVLLFRLKYDHPTSGCVKNLTISSAASFKYFKAYAGDRVSVVGKAVVACYADGSAQVGLASEKDYQEVTADARARETHDRILVIFRDADPKLEKDLRDMWYWSDWDGPAVRAELEASREAARQVWNITMAEPPPLHKVDERFKTLYKQTGLDWKTAIQTLCTRRGNWKFWYKLTSQEMQSAVQDRSAVQKGYHEVLGSAVSIQRAVEAILEKVYVTHQVAEAAKNVKQQRLRAIKYMELLAGFMSRAVAAFKTTVASNDKAYLPQVNAYMAGIQKLMAFMQAVMCDIPDMVLPIIAKLFELESARNNGDEPEILDPTAEDDATLQDASQQSEYDPYRAYCVEIAAYISPFLPRLPQPIADVYPDNVAQVAELQTVMRNDIAQQAGPSNVDV
jgi:hypothetical protein